MRRFPSVLAGLGLFLILGCGDESNSPLAPGAPPTQSPSAESGGDTSSGQESNSRESADSEPAIAMQILPGAPPEITFVGLTDDGGANDEPGQVDLTEFSRSDYESGFLWVRWSWDEVDVWTGSGQTGDACALFDTDADGNANYALCVQITNDATGEQIDQTPESPILYECGDKRAERCSQKVVAQVSVGGTLCAVDFVQPDPFGPVGDAYPEDTGAECKLDTSILDGGTPEMTNVCSFPSNSPNSNPFDCVVTPGAAFLEVQKVTSPAGASETFDFTLDPPASDGTPGFSLAHGESVLLALVVADAPFTVAETLLSNWSGTAACGSAGTLFVTETSVTVSGISVQSGQTVSCTFTNSAPPDITVTKTANPTSVPETGGSVTFSVSVTNNAAASVTLDALTDNVYGDLDDTGTCATEGTIASGATYSCSFTVPNLSGEPDSPHLNTATATASNEAGSDTDSDDATVTFTDVLPDIDVTKTANPTSVLETGGDVTYTVTVTNNNAEPVSLTLLNDDVFGDLAAYDDCDALPQTLAGSGGTYSCSFTETLIRPNGDEIHENTVTATASDDDGNTDTDTDNAVVTFTDVLPTITVTKTANPTSVPETGGDVTYTVTVSNTSTENLTLDSLIDDVFGDLNGKGDCSAPRTITSGGNYSCSFTESIFGEPSTPHINTVTATASDNDGNSDSANDSATVTFTDVLPDIDVSKTASPTSVPETGGNVTFSVTVTNNNAEDVTLDLLTDTVNSVVEDLNGVGTCATGGTIAGSGGTYSCSFTEFVSGDASGPDHTNTVTATASDDDDNSDTATDSAVVTFTDVLPDIDVTKTANPTSVPETGGDVTYTVTVTNNNAESVSLTLLNDDVFGDLADYDDCDALPQTLAGNGGAYTCSFTETLIRPNGDATHTNTVTATASDDDGNSDTATDSAVVTFLDELPDIAVTKTANPTSVPETGGNVEFTVVVTNNSAESVTLDALTDSDFGDLDGKGDCATGGTIASGGSYSCSFTEFVSGDHSGPDHSNTVTATASDNDGNSDSATDSATVSFDDVLPDIDVSKTANKASVPETGGDVTFTVTVTNNNAESVTLTSLTDDVFLNLNGKGDCATGGTIAGSGGTYSCSFTETLSGDASGPDHTNTVTATASDDDGNSDTATDSATVGFDDVLPDITLTKTVDPTSLPPAATVTSTPVTAQQILSGAPLDNTFLGAIDDAGANDEPGQVDLTQFSRSDVDSDFLWIRFSWDEKYVWTGSGQTGDACALLDTNGNGNADNALCVQITNDPAGTTITQTPESPILYECGDKKADRCSQKVVALAPSAIGDTECAVAFVNTDPFPAGDESPGDTGAECKLDRNVVSAPTMTNVCSYPSGSPNSNPFDCVVTPGAGFLVIQKATNPEQSGETFNFRVSGNGTTIDRSITDLLDGPDQTASLIPVPPGTYSVEELEQQIPANWSVTSATCGTGIGTYDGNVTVNGVGVQSGQTITCTFTNEWEFTGTVTYTIVVTNNGFETVTLDTLTDTVDNETVTLNGEGSCSTGGTILGGATYTCSFTKELTGQAGDTHTNEATGTASDNDGNSDTDSDTATVTFTGPV